MRRIERSEERGKSELGWLHSRFSYSFAEYLNPARMGFGLLRVVNQDTIESGKGFPLHHHEQMEIITIILEGELTHEDSIGNKSKLGLNDVQVMTAGTGINHAEWNHAPSPVRLLQIWIYPRERSLMPQYDQQTFDPKERNNRFQFLVSGIKKDDALFIHQEVTLLRAHIETGASVAHQVTNRESGVFLLLLSGAIHIGEDILSEGDSVEITGESVLQISADKEADVLLIEVPMQ